MNIEVDLLSLGLIFMVLLAFGGSCAGIGRYFRTADKFSLGLNTLLAIVFLITIGVFIVIDQAAGDYKYQTAMLSMLEYRAAWYRAVSSCSGLLRQ